MAEKYLYVIIVGKDGSGHKYSYGTLLFTKRINEVYTAPENPD